MKDKFDKKIELSKSAKIAIAIGTLFIIALSFIAGFFVNGLTISSKKESINWAIDMIDKYGCYYDEESGTLKEYSTSDYLQMITGNLDDYSTYYTKQEHELELKASEGNLYGNGLSYLYSLTEQKYYVRKIVGNSPAEHAGFMIGDVISAVEKNGETIQFDKNYSPIDFLNESAENVEYVYVVKRNDEEKKISCKRGLYKSNFVKYVDNEKSLSFVSLDNEPLKEKITNEGLSSLDDATAIISLQQFEGNAVSGIERAMEFLQDRGKTKLILDLRENGGGDTKVLSQVASYFIHQDGEKKPLVFVAKFKNGKEEKLYASGDKYNQNITKIVALANDNTASAAECLIGAMLYYKTLLVDNLVIEKHYNLERELVATTYGKGIMQTIINRFKTGEAIKLTTAVVYQPDGVTTIHNKGITTTSQNGVERGKALERAVEILG